MKTRKLPVPLTPSELRNIEKRIAQRTSEVIRLKEENAEIKKQMKRDEDGREAEIRRMSEIHESGWELRPVEIIERIHRDSGTAEVIRTDTNEVVEERALTPAEMKKANQTDIPGLN